jgi:hypothetical protein
LELFAQETTHGGPTHEYCVNRRTNAAGPLPSRNIARQRVPMKERDGYQVMANTVSLSLLESAS